MSGNRYPITNLQTLRRFGAQRSNRPTPLMTRNLRQLCPWEVSCSSDIVGMTIRSGSDFDEDVAALGNGNRDLVYLVWFVELDVNGLEKIDGLPRLFALLSLFWGETFWWIEGRDSGFLKGVDGDVWGVVIRRCGAGGCRRRSQIEISSD